MGQNAMSYSAKENLGTYERSWKVQLRHLLPGYDVFANVSFFFFFLFHLQGFGESFAK